MTNIARSLSQRAEFYLVVLVAFGYIVLGNVLSIFFPLAEPAISDESLRSLVVFELIVLLLLGALLYARGWRLSRFGPPLAVADLRAAAALAVGAYAVSLVIELSAAALGQNSQSAAASFVSNDIRVTSFLAVSTLNPVFEELLLCGYIVTVLKERQGFWTAVNVSLAIRLLCHLYQGPVGVISILPIGFVFTYWYARTGRLWPVILAHAAFDFTGLWPYLADE